MYVKFFSISVFFSVCICVEKFSILPLSSNDFKENQNKIKISFKENFLNYHFSIIKLSFILLCGRVTVDNLGN